MLFNDLREFITEVERLGEYKLVEGADWDLEIGLITAWQAEAGNSPLLLFDKIKGYKAGYRVVTSLFNTPKRVALALDLPREMWGIEFVKAWREKTKKELELIPPVYVDYGPIKENIHTGDDIDLFEFPTPKWGEFDGGRYIGTGCMVITRDLDEGWVNCGTYRVQIHDKSTATVQISTPARNAAVIRQKYWAKGMGCPTAVVCGGTEPVLWGVSTMAIPWGVSEYDYAGWLRGKPIEVTRGVTTDLPIPAGAEIVLEGEVMPPEAGLIEEGPFGEWTGYYGGATQQPIFRVKSILHRNDPIIHGAPNVTRFGSHATLAREPMRSALVWDELDSRVPGVKGVWFVEDASAHPMLVVSIKQMYPAHAKQTALSAASAVSAASNLCWVIIVDDDIDPSNMSEVLWAMGLRCDPETGVEVIRGAGLATHLKPSLSPEKRSSGDITQGIAIIMACKPYYWMDKFPKTVTPSPEQLQKVKEKWGQLFQSS